MKMTLPFKPHVLALICSAGLCAASAGLYIKSRTVEAPVEPQSTQQLRLTLAVTLSCNGFRTSRNTRRRQIRIQHCTKSMGRARRAVSRLYFHKLLMASTYPTNVAQAVQWSHDNPLKQGDAAIQAVSDQPWDASVKSLVAFPQLMALMAKTRNGCKTWAMLFWRSRRT